MLLSAGPDSAAAQWAHTCVYNKHMQWPCDHYIWCIARVSVRKIIKSWDEKPEKRLFVLTCSAVWELLLLKCKVWQSHKGTRGSTEETLNISLYKYMWICERKEFSWVQRFERLRWGDLAPCRGVRGHAPPGENRVHFKAKCTTRATLRGLIYKERRALANNFVLQ